MVHTVISKSCIPPTVNGFVTSTVIVCLYVASAMIGCLCIIRLVIGRFHFTHEAVMGQLRIIRKMLGWLFITR